MVNCEHGRRIQGLDPLQRPQFRFICDGLHQYPPAGAYRGYGTMQSYMRWK
jgi:hypothetical protein